MLPLLPIVIVSELASVVVNDAMMLCVAALFRGVVYVHAFHLLFLCIYSINILIVGGSGTVVLYNRSTIYNTYANNSAILLLT